MGKNRNFKNFATAVEGEQQTAQPEGDERSAERSTVDVMREALQQAKDLGIEGADPANAEALIERARQAGEQQRIEDEEHSAEPIKPEGETETLPVAPVLVLGIGQFVRQMMLKSTKTNAEILELVHKHFPEAKTTPACIAWYKSDLRKKGLISGSAVRGARSIVEFTPEMLAELCK